jgi:RNA polymerase subunit RPABC4/transcription elongation factor Spt4
LWSEAPKTKEREMKICSNCGKAVDQKWSMCPYCSKKV